MQTNVKTKFDCKKIIALFILLKITKAAFGQTKISVKEAASHIGETVTICDKVYSTKLIDGSNMTLLNLGAVYPNQLLTVMIKGRDRSKFKDAPETYFKGKNMCVTGKVVDYKGKPEIVISDPSEMKLDGMN
jgi:micrococcal nuclease